MRAIAIESIKDGVCRYYGEGDLIEGKVPDVEPFNHLGIKNPCIKLDNGKHVWGFQCWWGESEKTLAKYKDSIKKMVLVEIEDILPYEGAPVNPAVDE